MKDPTVLVLAVQQTLIVRLSECGSICSVPAKRVNTAFQETGRKSRRHAKVGADRTHFRWASVEFGDYEESKAQTRMRSSQGPGSALNSAFGLESGTKQQSQTCSLTFCIDRNRIAQTPAALPLATGPVECRFFPLVLFLSFLLTKLEVANIVCCILCVRMWSVVSPTSWFLQRICWWLVWH